MLAFFSLTDGDGQSEHLLPVCEDAKCQKSAIYLTKPGLDQVSWVWNCKDKGKCCASWNNGKQENVFSGEKNETASPVVIAYKTLLFIYLFIAYLKKIYGFGGRGCIPRILYNG